MERFSSKDPSSVIRVLEENNVDVCGLQEVPGAKQLHALFADSPYACRFDDLYWSYGNALVYRKDRFTLVAHTLHLLKDGSGKKGALSVDLQRNGSKQILRFFVTHLSAKTEPQRLKEVGKLLDIVKLSEIPYFICGDFNSLSRGDYSDAEWESITSVRATNHWESPKTEVVQRMKDAGFSDCLSEVGKPEPTSRFNTRVDYIWSAGWDIRSARVVTSDHNLSDHKPVICSFYTM